MEGKTEHAEQLNREIERRLEEMEGKDYVFQERFRRKDYILAGVVVMICLIMVAAGVRM